MLLSNMAYKKQEAKRDFSDYHPRTGYKKYASRKPRSYSISDELHDDISALAKTEGVSTSLLVEKAIESFIKIMDRKNLRKG